MISDSLKSRIEKLKEMISRGTPGEQAASKAILENLMTKYDLSDEDLSEITLYKKQFHWKTLQTRSLLFQIIYSVCGDIPIYEPVYYAGTKKYLSAEVTLAEEAEIRFLYDFYSLKLEELFTLTTKAFIQKNELFPDETVRVPPKKEKESFFLTDEEEKMLLLASVIEKSECRLGIKDKTKNS